MTEPTPTPDAGLLPVTLKPCPFCGGDGEVRKDDLSGQHTASCDKCYAQIDAEPTREQAITAWNTRAPVQSASPSGLGGQDRKFGFDGKQFVNRVSGEPIPLDEPIIIFRARDRHTEHVLRDYLSMAEDEHHQQAIRDRMQEFAAWRDANPDKIKEPGITRHIRLNSEAALTAPAPTDAAEREVERMIALVRRMAGQHEGSLRPGASHSDYAEARSILAALTEQEKSA